MEIRNTNLGYRSKHVKVVWDKQNYKNTEHDDNTYSISAAFIRLAIQKDRI